jgi:hypothetical protein
MKITLDPTEMIAASETLRNCAVEAADIGSQLSACACCAMPADLQTAVDDLASTVDRALDSVAARLSAQAADLTNRAQIAASDSLPAAISAVDTGTALGTAASGSPMFTTSIIGGQSLTEPIIFGTAPAAASPGLTVSIIGGNAEGDLGLGGSSIAATGLGVSMMGGQQGSLFGDPPGGSPGLTVSVIGGPIDPLFPDSTIHYPADWDLLLPPSGVGGSLPTLSFPNGRATSPDPMLSLMAVIGGTPFGQIHVV